MSDQKPDYSLMTPALWKTLAELCYDARRKPELVGIVEGFYEDHNLPGPPRLGWYGNYADWLRFGVNLVKRHPIRRAMFYDLYPIESREGNWLFLRDMTLREAVPELPYFIPRQFGALMRRVEKYETLELALHALTEIALGWAEDKAGFNR